MQDTIDFILNLNKNHWQDSAYQWFYYASVLLILIFEKRRMVRIVFGWVPVIYLVFIFNPITAKLLNIAGLHDQGYAARLFSFMPLMYVIAMSFTALLRIDDAWIKLAGVVLVGAVICLTGRNIYREPWLTRAENAAKVPQDTFEILEAIEPQDGNPVAIAVIDAGAVYIRQVADVLTPYGRYMGPLGQMLSMKSPDIRQVMELAGQQDVDYIVTRRTKRTLAAFLKYRYKPFALTNNYAIFKVQGVNRVNRILNNRRQVIREMETNPYGEVVKDSTGGYAYSYDYDANGRVAKITRLDKDGNPTDGGRAYASMKRTYYLDGDIKTVSYFDQDDRPLIMSGRYETKYIYDINSKVIEEIYYDQFGAKMSRLDGQYAACKFSYSPSGKINGESYLNEKGKPTRSAWGYARMYRTYDEDDRPVRETYYDVDRTVLGMVGEGLSSNGECLNEFCQYTAGARKNEGREIVFETNRKNNAFKTVRLRLKDCTTDALLCEISVTNGTGVISGAYIHSLPDGLYRLELIGYANIEDESISSAVYLSEGERLYYNYSIDEFQEKAIKIRNCYIGRENVAG